MGGGVEIVGFLRFGIYYFGRKYLDVRVNSVVAVGM